ncbi:MAG TPA: aminopeptidase P family N-terminal domain-containing protein, partial [Solirubrobacteraceae bacterium]
MGERTERLAAQMREREVDVLLVASPINVCYLTGFTGSNGLALIAADPSEGSGAADRFFTDFRYTTQSAEQVAPQFERKIVTGRLLEAAVRSLDGSAGRLGFDDASVTVADHAALAEALPQGWELVGCAGAVEQLRAVKDAGEIERMRAAAELADEALRSVLEDGLIGREERDVAIELELRMRRLGA